MQKLFDSQLNYLRVLVRLLEILFSPDLVGRMEKTDFLKRDVNLLLRDGSALILF